MSLDPIGLNLHYSFHRPQILGWAGPMSIHSEVHALLDDIIRMGGSQHALEVHIPSMI